MSFKKHISEAIIKAKRGVSLLKFLSRYLNRSKLDLAFKMHVRPHLEYGDVIFHDRSSELMKLLESVQYQAGLVVAGCWKGTSTTKLYNELGWESLSDRRKFHRMSLYYKILNNETPSYLSDHLLVAPPSGTIRLSNTFFPYCYNEWMKIVPELTTSISLASFKSQYLKLIRPPKCNFFGIHDRNGLPLLTRLRVNFSDLREHRFNHSFNCLNPSCKCCTEDESTEHFLLRCPLYSTTRQTLLSNLAIAVNDEILNLPHDHLASILLYGSTSFNHITNRTILTITIHFIKASGRFNKIEAYS